MVKIAVRSVWLGRGISTWRSKRPGSQERWVEYLRAIGGRYDHDARRGIEAVHLGQELIEGLFPLVV